MLLATFSSRPAKHGPPGDYIPSRQPLPQPGAIQARAKHACVTVTHAFDRFFFVKTILPLAWSTQGTAHRVFPDERQGFTEQHEHRAPAQARPASRRCQSGTRWTARQLSSCVSPLAPRPAEEVAAVDVPAIVRGAAEDDNDEMIRVVPAAGNKARSGGGRGASLDTVISFDL